MTAPVLDITGFQQRVYQAPRCWKLVADVYRELLGVAPNEVELPSDSMRRAARAFRLQLFRRTPGMHQVGNPQDLAVVLMWHTLRQRHAHCGICWHGGVLHATESATLYQDLASLRAIYPVMQFWAWGQA